MTMRVFLLLVLALPQVACRPDIGPPDYGQFVAGDDDDSAGIDPNNLPGPDPYEDGEERLSIGIFYEGGFSSEIAIDDLTNHYYIYDGTFDTYEDFEEREEGFKSDVIAPTGLGFWGGGVTWDQPIDLSDWTQLHISLRSDGPDFAAFNLGFGGGGGSEVTAAVADYGFVNDGEWHQIVIPLSDFTAGGAALDAVGLPVQLIAAVPISGQELRVDNLYFSKETVE